VAGGAANKRVFLYYRRAGDIAWREAYHLTYSPVSFDAFNPEDSIRYRGSIVHLEPDTTYEIQVALEGTSTRAGIKAKTWSENFPIGSTVNVQPTGQTIRISQSGSAGAYRVYDGGGALFTVPRTVSNNIVIDSGVSYIIIRRFKLKGAAGNPILFGGTSTNHHVVIEDNEITDWGTAEMADGHARLAIWAGFGNTQLVMQRNRIYNPATSSPSWLCCHPGGVQGIGISYNQKTPTSNAGQNVVRYNEIYSTNGNSYGDGFQIASPDTDVYGNYISNVHDDGMEIEGPVRNQRIWGNYIEESSIAIGNAPVTVGPLYVWRNVVGPTTGHPTSAANSTNGPFLKFGFSYRVINGVTYGAERMTGLQFIFHNTIYNKNNNGFDGLGTERAGGDRVIRNTTSRNNILHVRSSTLRSISLSSQNRDNSFDYDLFSAGVPAGSEMNGVSGAPTYVSTSGFNASNRSGDFRPATESKGVDEGQFIPNFSGTYSGTAPDMGAQEAGSSPVVYGINSKMN
jgi:hypothetical protein